MGKSGAVLWKLASAVAGVRGWHRQGQKDFGYACAISGGYRGLVLLGQSKPGSGFRLGSHQGSGCGLR